MPAPIAIDGETFYDKKCSVKPLGTWAYCHHPDFYVYLMSVHDGEETWVGHPKDFNWEYLRGRHLLAHNAFFELNWIKALIERGEIPDFGKINIDCTANMSAYLCNRRSLKDAVNFLLGETMSKDARSSMEGKHWADVQNTDQGREFIQYAGNDAVKSWQIFDKFGDRWTPFERALSRMTINQCLGGIFIDVPKLDHYLERSKRFLFEIESRLPWLHDGTGAKPTSTKAIAMACRAAGIPCTPIKSTEGEEAYEAWFKRYREQYPWVSAVAEWRSTNKLIGSLETIKARLRPDGSLSFELKYGGAHTLRWSGAAGLNMQNLKKDPLFIDRGRLLRQDEQSAVDFWACVDQIWEAKKLVS